MLARRLFSIASAREEIRVCVYEEIDLSALKCFLRFKKEEERVVIDQPMRHFLPIMHERCRFLMPDASSLSVTVQKLIVKTFFSLVQVRKSKHAEFS